LTKNVITEQKIFAITRDNSDIIFLSDLRLNSIKQVSACKEICKTLYFRGYKFIHNSPTSLRGVGILIKKEVFDSSTIFSTIRDRDGNYILLDIEYNNHRITVGSIYGANTNEGIDMYDNLQRDILGLNNSEIVLGGDFNPLVPRNLSCEYFAETFVRGVFWAH